MQRSVIETVMGAVVLLVAGFFLVLAYNTTDLRPVAGYQVSARFNSVDGLAVGADVRIGGVKVGSVVDQYIDPEFYQAVVEMSVRSDVKLPADSLATVSSTGILGAKYLKLEPGRSDELLREGGTIERTKDVISLEELIGKVIFLVTDEKVE